VAFSVADGRLYEKKEASLA